MIDSPSHEFSRAPGAGRKAPFQIVLTGNPNSGKTTLFNALTGLSAKVGNYPGVTVERKEGRLLHAPKEPGMVVLDLPGAYSLSPQSLDEQIARDVLFHRVPGVPPPDLVIVVVDASNLQRNLYFATQVIELGYRTFVALNMMDVARENGHVIDVERLSEQLGTPVFPIVASRGDGVDALRKDILATADASRAALASRQFCSLPGVLSVEVTALAGALIQAFPQSCFQSRAESLLVLSDERFLLLSGPHYPEAICSAVAAARKRLDQQGLDWRSAAIEARYARIAEIQKSVTTETSINRETVSDRLDRVLTDRVWGLLIFLAVMTLMFQSIFTFAEFPMKALEQGVGWVGSEVGKWIRPGPLNDLIVNGVIKGVGAVVVFLPQICLLFLFIGLLEDTGYMARAAFLMDRLMSRVGLHGKSFIPMLSSFACAIPGIMATRTIESPKDRLVTILVAPLMSCSARLPVYTLLIAACIPDRRVLGVLKLAGLTMLCMYLLGIVVALLMAWLFKKTLLKGPTPMLIMELPPYKRPVTHVVLRHMWDRSKLFLRRAGTVILGINILLWFLASYPRVRTSNAEYVTQRDRLMASAFPSMTRAEADARLVSLRERKRVTGETNEAERVIEWDVREANRQAGERLRHSFAGRIGHFIEPAIRPLGFDWKIGIGIVSSFAAREVFVSTMSLVYNVGEADDSPEATRTLAQTLREQVRPEDGKPVYTTLVAVTLMVFYVFALQCVSTVAIVRRETNSWKWPLFQWVYMGVLAWFLAFLTYQGGRLLGLG
ncbi:MAG: ferrous iron transport protein [Verrucomicrobiota bacterium]|jgi:ferrous iron transport protein B